MRSIYRKRTLKRAGIIFLVVFSLSSAGAAVHGYYKWRECYRAGQKTEQRLQSLECPLYVADMDLYKGMILSEEHVRKEIRYTDQQTDRYISEEDFGKILLTDVKTETCLLDVMLADATPGIRDVFVSEVELPTHLEVNRRVDIRICYGNGEDYTVLADKTIKKMEENEGIVLGLTEEEILLLSSAITDGKVYTDVRLYAVTYPEQETGGKTRISYVPNREILQMLDRESTEGESRQNLEQRLLQRENR